MPLGAFDLARVLHVLSAALALGALATLPILRTKIQGAENSQFAAYGLELMGRIEGWIVAPATLGVVAFGLAMVEGPIARFSFTAPGSGWLHVGTTLWTLLALALYGLFRARRGLQEEAAGGATGGEEVARLWRWWSIAWSGATLALAGGVAAMALKLGA